MVEIEIDVERHHQIPGAISEGFREGLRDGGEWLLDEGERQAKDIILSAERIWRSKLREGFVSDGGSGDFTRPTGWKGKLKNEAPHAELNERGLKPGSSPPVQKIAPWVDDQLGTSLPGVPTSSYNPENWDPQLTALAEEYSPGVVLTSFAVKNSLEDEGYSGIGFMQTTEEYLNGVGPMVVREKVKKHLRREIRERGLS